MNAQADVSVQLVDACFGLLVLSGWRFELRRPREGAELPAALDAAGIYRRGKVVTWLRFILSL